jgi:hypothetical protein
LTLYRIEIEAENEGELETVLADGRWSVEVIEPGDDADGLHAAYLSGKYDERLRAEHKGVSKDLEEADAFFKTLLTWTTAELAAVFAGLNKVLAVGAKPPENRTIEDLADFVEILSIIPEGKNDALTADDSSEQPGSGTESG